MAKKRRPGRPRLGAEARSVVVPVRLTKAQYKAIEDSARDAGQTLADWARVRLGDGVATRITVEPEDDEWYWEAFDRHGNKLAGGVVDDPKTVRARVEGDHGVRVDEDVAIEASEPR